MFEFRLQSVLHLRRQERDQKRSALADAYSAERAIESQIEDLEREIAQTQSLTRSAAQPGRINVDELADTKRFQLVLQAQIISLRAQKQQVSDLAEARRAELVEADQQVRAFERLRERQFAEYESARVAREIHELDDLAGIQFLRGQGVQTPAPPRSDGGLETQEVIDE